MSAETIEIPTRFNGPPGSGHGGYVSGRLAALAGEPAEVTLRSPTPLGKQLAVESTDGGARLLDGETLIAEARRTEPLALDVPPPLGLEEAERSRSRYSGSDLFDTCFVCGTRREGVQRVHPGPVDDRTGAATPWTPTDAWLADGEGAVRPEFVWAVLDCPTYFGYFVGEDPAIAMLGRFAVDRLAPVAMGEPHVIQAWRIGRDGRKLRAGAALFDAEGELLARAHATMIEIEAIPEAARA